MFNVFLTDCFNEYPEKEVITTILDDRNLKVERILSFGHTSDWLMQEENEFVCLLQGEAILEFVDKEVVLRSGDTINIQKGVKHKVNMTSVNPCCIWLCFFYT